MIQTVMKKAWAPHFPGFLSCSPSPLTPFFHSSLVPLHAPSTLRRALLSLSLLLCLSQCFTLRQPPLPLFPQSVLVQLMGLTAEVQTAQKAHQRVVRRRPGRFTLHHSLYSEATVSRGRQSSEKEVRQALDVGRVGVGHAEGRLSGMSAGGVGLLCQRDGHDDICDAHHRSMVQSAVSEGNSDETLVLSPDHGERTEDSRDGDRKGHTDSVIWGGRGQAEEELVGKVWVCCGVYCGWYV